MLQPLFSDTNGSAMARLHAILFVIRMCGCWMLLLYLHKYFLAYFYVSHPMIKYGRHLTVHLHRRRSRGGQKIYFSFRKHEKVTYWWNVCSERKKKPLCCLQAQSLWYFNVRSSRVIIKCQILSNSFFGFSWHFLSGFEIKTI